MILIADYLIVFVAGVIIGIALPSILIRLKNAIAVKRWQWHSKQKAGMDEGDYHRRTANDVRDQILSFTPREKWLFREGFGLAEKAQTRFMAKLYRGEFKTRDECNQWLDIRFRKSMLDMDVVKIGDLSKECLEVWENDCKDSLKFVKENLHPIIAKYVKQ
jgi:hypothetical protein